MIVLLFNVVAKSQNSMMPAFSFWDINGDKRFKGGEIYNDKQLQVIVKFKISKTELCTTPHKMTGDPETKNSEWLNKPLNYWTVSLTFRNNGPNRIIFHGHSFTIAFRDRNALGYWVCWSPNTNQGELTQFVEWPFEMEPGRAFAPVLMPGKTYILESNIAGFWAIKPSNDHDVVLTQLYLPPSTLLSESSKSAQIKMDESTDSKVYHDYNKLIADYNKAAQAGDFAKVRVILKELIAIATKHFPEDVAEYKATLEKVQKAEQESLNSARKNSSIDKKLDELELLIGKQKLLLSRVLKGDVSAAQELNDVNLKINDLNNYFLRYAADFSDDQSKRLESLATKMAADVTSITESELADQQKKLEELEKAKEIESKVNESRWPTPIYIPPAKARDRTPIKGQTFGGAKLKTN